MKCKCILPQQEVGIRETYINAYGGYESVCGSVLIFTLVDICISSPPDRASPSITAHPFVRLTAYKQPGNDGALQLVQQQWLINIHIPLSNPLMPIFVSHALAVECYSFQRGEPDRCPNIWGELWPLVSPRVLLLSSSVRLALWVDKYNFYFDIGWTVIVFTCDVGNS